MSHSLLLQKGGRGGLSHTTVTLMVVRMLIKIRNVGNCHYESCKKLKENEITHIISGSLIRENPTAKRQEMKPGNKFQSCSYESKFIYLHEQNLISSPCLCMMCIWMSVMCSIRTLQCWKHVRHCEALLRLTYMIWQGCKKNRKRRFVLLKHFNVSGNRATSSIFLTKHLHQATAHISGVMIVFIRQVLLWWLLH